jgi:biotin carboxyl carrier protein
VLLLAEGNEGEDTMLGSRHPGGDSDDGRIACSAEELHAVERLITAPMAGTFHPTFTDISVEKPLAVAVGDEIGVLVQSGEKHTVESPFTGLLLGMLALPGERVRCDQPLAWLTTDDDHPLWDY